RHRVDEIPLGALEIADAHRIHKQTDAVGFVDLVTRAAAFLDHQSVLETRTATALDEYTKASANLVFFGEQLVDLRGCRLGHVDHLNLLRELYRPTQGRTSTRMTGPVLYLLILARFSRPPQLPIVASACADSCSMSLWRLLPCESIVTIAGHASPVSVHNRRERLHRQLPHRLGRTKLH